MNNMKVWAEESKRIEELLKLATSDPAGYAAELYQTTVEALHSCDRQNDLQDALNLVKKAEDLYRNVRKSHYLTYCKYYFRFSSEYAMWDYIYYNSHRDEYSGLAKKLMEKSLVLHAKTSCTMEYKSAMKCDNPDEWLELVYDNAIACYRAYIILNAFNAKRDAEKMAEKAQTWVEKWPDLVDEYKKIDEQMK